MRLSERSVRAGVKAPLGRGVSFVAVVLFLTLLASVALAPIGERAAAASVRIASIVSVSGTVEVKKSGGKKFFKAYKDMPLNAGDHLKTGDKSTVTIRVQDRADEATLGGGSSLYISELRDTSGKKKSNFTLWTGSMWVKASTLVSTKDEFEVETPTAVMGVRGTNLFVTVDPLTGESMFMIASGVGEVFSKNTGKKDDKPSTIYPSQMLNTYFDNKKRSEKDEVVFVNLEQFIQNAGSGVIEAIIMNKAAIDKENEELLEKLRKAIDSGTGIDPKQANGLDIRSMEDLERIRQNLDDMVANLVKEAIKQQKLDPGQAKKLVDEANRSLDKKIDLDRAKEPVLTEKEKEKQRQAEQLKRQRDLEKQQQEQALAEKQKRQQEQVAKLAEQARLLQEANQRKQEEQKKKKEEEYLKKLAEAQLKAFQDAKKKLEGAAVAPTPTSPPISTPIPTSPPPTPTIPAPPALNQPGTITGSLEQTVSGSAGVAYGPETGTVTVTGNLTITGGQAATGIYTLRNMIIQGNLSVTVPNGSVMLLDSVTVQGTTTIVDVASNTFGSSAVHGGAIDVQDGNGARIVLQGSAGSGTVRVTGSGQIVLEGSYSGDVIIQGNATSIVLKGQFTGKVQVNVPNVSMTVDSAALFIGTLEINANGFSLDDTSNKVGTIVPGSGVEVHPDILNNAKLIRLNQAKNASAVLALLLEYEYADAYQWHAEQLLARRNNSQGGSGFASWAQASAEIVEVLAMKEPGPVLETEGEPYPGMEILAFSFDGEDPDYQDWTDRVDKVYVYKGSLPDGELLRTVSVNAIEGNDAGLAKLEDGRLELDGSIFASTGTGSYSFRLTAVGRFGDVVHTFQLSSADWLSGEMDLTGKTIVSQEAAGTEDREFGPVSDMLAVPGNLHLVGDGSGTYTLRNLDVAGDLVINLPYGSVVLLDSVTVTGTTYIAGISGGSATGGGGFQPLFAVTEPIDVPPVTSGYGFASSAQHDSLIELLDRDGATVRLEPPASSTNLSITGGGQVLLQGLYHADVWIAEGAEAVALTIAADAKVMAQLHIDAPGVDLDVQGVLLDIGIGEQVEATASVQEAKQQILQYQQAIMEAWYRFNSQYEYEGSKEDLSEFKQALEAAGFELGRTTYLYLLFNHLNYEDNFPYSLLDIRDWLNGWGELPGIAPDLEDGASLAIEDMPYGQPLRFVYSAYTPVEGGEGEEEWSEDIEWYDWPDWFDAASGVTISQTVGDEVIERYYPIVSWLGCIIEMPYECSELSRWDMTAFHPGEATATIHGGFRFLTEEGGYASSANGLYDDIANLSFTIGDPVEADRNDTWNVTQFVYGEENKVLDWSNSECAEYSQYSEYPECPEFWTTVNNLTIRGSGSGTYTLQNIVIAGELIIDIPNGSLVLGDNVYFESRGYQGAAEIVVQDISSDANGGLIIQGTVDNAVIHVMDSNEARLYMEDMPYRASPVVNLYGSGIVKLAGYYDYVNVYNEVEEQGYGMEAIANRDIYLSEGAIIQVMSVESNRGNVRLADDGGSILELNANREMQHGPDPSITNYLDMLEDLLLELNAALSADSYSEAQSKLDPVLAFVGFSGSNESVWFYLIGNSNGGYSNLRTMQQHMKYYQGGSISA